MAAATTLGVLGLACSEAPKSAPIAARTGRAARKLVGRSGSGGIFASGGSSGSGGTVGSGGSVGSGGTVGSGGSVGSGGNPGSGGAGGDKIAPTMTPPAPVSQSGGNPGSGGSGSGGNGAAAATGGSAADPFVLAWQDDFDTLDLSAWQLQTFTFLGNLAQFSTQNASVSSGI